jgi:hypothetical protein
MQLMRQVFLYEVIHNRGCNIVLELKKRGTNQLAPAWGGDTQAIRFCSLAHSGRPNECAKVATPAQDKLFPAGQLTGVIYPAT